MIEEISDVFFEALVLKDPPNEPLNEAPMALFTHLGQPNKYPSST